MLIRGKRLEEGGAYFKVRDIHHIKCQNFVFVLFNKEIETQNETKNLKRKKINKQKNKQNSKISKIV